DDSLAGISYANSAVPTSPVVYTFDPSYPRLANRQNGVGITIYGYYPVSDPPGLGAGQVARVDGPLTNETVAYAYDELGRATSRSINGVTESATFDAAGWTTQFIN